MNGSARLMIVGGGPFQLGIIRAAQTLGCEVVVVDRDARAPGMTLADFSFSVDTRDIAAITAIAKRLNVVGAATAASDAAVDAVAAVNEVVGRAGLTPEVARRCRDKLTTFDTLRAGGVAVPETRRVGTLEEALATADAVGGYPLITKPRSSAGGRGVSIVREPGEMAAGLARALEWALPGQGALLQQYARGISAGVEAFFSEAKVARAFVLNDEYRDGFISPIGHSLPCSLSPELQDSIVADIERAAGVLGITDGPANFDLRRAGDDTVIIEVNARLGGNSISDLVRVCFRADLASATVQSAVGRDPAPYLHASDPRPAATRLMVAHGRGRTVMPEDPFAKWQGIGAIVALKSAVQHGVPAAMTVNDWTLVGSCVVTGDSAASAVSFAEEVCADIEAGISLAAEG